MALPYGRFPKFVKKKRDQEPSRQNVRIRLRGTHNLEQMSLQLQKIIATVELHGAHGVERCSLHLTPVNRNGDQIVLRNREGKMTDTVEVFVPVSVKFRKATDD